jgi:hypothetical protein
MQLCVPELRPVANVRLFNAELRQFGNDLEKWRLYKVRLRAQQGSICTYAFEALVHLRRGRGFGSEYASC